MGPGLVVAGILALAGLWLALRRDPDPRAGVDQGSTTPDLGNLVGLPVPPSSIRPGDRPGLSDPAELPGFSKGSQVIPDSPPGERDGELPDPNDYPDEFVSVPGNRNAERAFLGLDLSNVTGALVAGVGYAYGLRQQPEDIIYTMHGTRLPNLDPVLVRAIVNVETMRTHSWREAVGAIRAERRGDDFLDWSVGPMQVRTDTAKWVAPFRELNREQIRDRLLDPLTSIAVGMKYLQLQLARYQSPPPSPWPREAWIAAAYNGGTAVYNFRRNVFRNQTYVARVLADMQKFDEAFPSRRGLIKIPAVLGG